MGVSLASLNSDKCCDLVTAVLCVISCDIGPRHHGTRLYIPAVHASINFYRAAYHVHFALYHLIPSLGKIAYYMLLCCITMNNQAGIHSGTKRPIQLLGFYSQFMNLMEKCFALIYQSEHDKAKLSWHAQIVVGILCSLVELLYIITRYIISYLFEFWTKNCQCNGSVAQSHYWTLKHH